MKPGKGKHTRREFFRGVARGGLLAGMGAAVALLWTRRGDSPLSGQTCENLGLCRRCGSFGACELPRAQIVRRAEAKG